MGNQQRIQSITACSDSLYRVRRTSTTPECVSNTNGQNQRSHRINSYRDVSTTEGVNSFPYTSDTRLPTVSPVSGSNVHKGVLVTARMKAEGLVQSELGWLHGDEFIPRPELDLQEYTLGSGSGGTDSFPRQILFAPTARMMESQMASGPSESRLSEQSFLQIGADPPQGHRGLSNSLGIQEGGSDSVNPVKNGEAKSHSDVDQPSKENAPVHPPSSENTLPSDQDNEQAMFDPKQPCDEDEGIESSDNSAAESDGEDAQEEHTPLSYQIPTDALRTAMSASENSAGSYYSQALYRGPEGKLVNIHYCRNLEVANRVAPYFLEEKVIGFDIEWKPFPFDKTSIKENASLIQIASEDRIALFHIALFKGKTAEELLPPVLRIIIESPDIYKVGVAIKGDFSRLEKFLGVKPKGVFELSRLHNLVENYDDDPTKAGSKKLYALAKQVQEHLQLPLYKGAVRESDWSQPLKYDQISYAATDAYAGLRIWDVLEAKRKMLRPVPPRPALCDFDPLPKPKATPTAKRVRKATPVAEKEEENAEEVPEAVEQPGEDESSYETAAEEMVDSHELEGIPDFESSSESSAQSADSDSEYVPPVRRLGRIALRKPQDEDIPSIPRQVQRVGRVASEQIDPGYPTLPSISSSDETDSSDDAFDPPVHVPKRRVPRTSRAASKPSLPKEDTEMKDVSDAESLEDELLALSLDFTDKQGMDAKQVDTELHQPEQEQVALTSKPVPVLAKGEDNVQDTEPPSKTSKDAEKSTPDVSTPTFAPLSTTAQKPEYTAAESWAQSYLFNTIPSASSSSSTPSRIRATVPHLRAYHLWHHQHLPLSEIAACLRTPPLAESTVCSYILQAIALERLEYRTEDMRLVLKALPKALRMTRWKWLVEKIGGVE